MNFLMSDFSEQELCFFNQSFLNFPLCRTILKQKRSDSVKRFNEIIKEHFLRKEVKKCEDADTAAVE